MRSSVRLAANVLYDSFVRNFSNPLNSLFYDKNIDQLLILDKKFERIMSFEQINEQKY